MPASRDPLDTLERGVRLQLGDPLFVGCALECCADSLASAFAEGGHSPAAMHMLDAIEQLRTAVRVIAERTFGELAKEDLKRRVACAMKDFSSRRGP